MHNLKPFLSSRSPADQTRAHGGIVNVSGAANSVVLPDFFCIDTSYANLFRMAQISIAHEKHSRLSPPRIPKIDDGNAKGNF